MPFKISLPWKISIFLVAWTVFISFAHYQLNFDHGSRKTVYMGYMPVITNLASPLLDNASKDNDDIRFKALKFASFAEMAESLRNGKIEAAFIIAPLSIVLRQQGEDIKIVYIGNRHESTLVTRKDLNVRSLSDLAGSKIAVPMRYSGHNITLRKLIKERGLEGQINVVEMNPPDMASALSGGVLDAYFVGEPFAAQTLYSGDSERLYYAEEIEEGFICNLMIVRNDLIKNEPETVQMLVRAAVRSGVWAQKNVEQAAKIAAKYWNQPLPLVNYALSQPKNRTVFNRYLPKQTEMQAMADDMLKEGMVKNNDITGLVDDSFASKVDLDNITEDIQSIF
ncbi:MAG: PhnD/SsuA/transferrin family substrate-binding protein [Methylococcaceae bacterium]|nr:PhnD/SsuA/transferrin family substrate-binding protein [Methylococcaceae bacterium]